MTLELITSGKDDQVWEVPGCSMHLPDGAVIASVPRLPVLDVGDVVTRPHSSQANFFFVVDVHHVTLDVVVDLRLVTIFQGQRHWPVRPGDFRIHPEESTALLVGVLDAEGNHSRALLHGRLGCRCLKQQLSGVHSSRETADLCSLGSNGDDNALVCELRLRVAVQPSKPSVEKYLTEALCSVLLFAGCKVRMSAHLEQQVRR